MNPCGKLSLFQGARYVAIADFFYAIMAITFITFELISTSKHGLAIHNKSIPLMQTRLPTVLGTYLVLSVINMMLAILLYIGITRDSILKCRTFLVTSKLSTIAGIGMLIYHGCHLNELSVSVLNAEFFISLVYHVYKIYALLVILAFVRELGKLLDSDADERGNIKRRRYQSLDSTASGSEEGDVAKHVFFGIPFAGRHYITGDRLKIDYDTCIEYDETTSTIKGVLQAPNDTVKKQNVAIKVLKNNFRTETHMIELIKEAKLMLRIGNHEHILRLLGIHCETPPEDMSRKGNVMLVMEDYPARRLDEFLGKSYENQLVNFRNLLEQETPLLRAKSRVNRLGTVYENADAIQFHQLESFSTVNMIQWAYQLASAMEYLHKKDIVFGNLQANALILEKASTIKLTNFGLASELQESNNIVNSIYLPGKISWRWTALECLISTNKGLQTQFTEKTDVWSFGSTLWEIFSMGQAPNHMASSLSDYIGALESGKRPEKPKFASEGIYKLMHTCWNENPGDRPSFSVLALFFRQLVTKSMQNNFI